MVIMQPLVDHPVVIWPPVNSSIVSLVFIILAQSGRLSLAGPLNVTETYPVYPHSLAAHWKPFHVFHPQLFSFIFSICSVGVCKSYSCTCLREMLIIIIMLCAAKCCMRLDMTVCQAVITCLGNDVVTLNYSGFISLYVYWCRSAYFMTCLDVTSSVMMSPKLTVILHIFMALYTILYDYGTMHGLMSLCVP